MSEDHGVKSYLAGRALVATVLGFALLAAAPVPGYAQDKPFDGVTLRVGTYGGSWRDTIHDLVGSELERLGAKVEYVVGSTRDNVTKLIADRSGTPPIDVMEIDDTSVSTVREGQFLDTLDYQQLPNAAALDDSQRREDMTAIWLTQHGIVYNTEKFAENDIPPPTGFSDLLDPRLEGHVSFPDINAGFSVTGLTGFAVEAGGDEGNIEPGFEKVKELDVATFFKSSPAVGSQFQSGDVWAAWWQAGWAMRLRKAGVPVAVVNPRLKDKVGMAQMGWIGILKGTPNRAAAEAFINRYLDPAVQEELTRRTGVVAVHPEAGRKLVSDPELNEFLILDPEDVRNIYFVDMSKVKMEEWVDRWNRVLAQ